MYVYVCVFSNDIGVEGGVGLFHSLQENESLRKIDLSGMSGINRNHIAKPGAQAIAGIHASPYACVSFTSSLYLFLFLINVVVFVK